MSTRLSLLHPYPAMISDSLAEQLSDEFVSCGMRVLDPFCGTGRTLLAAAALGAECIGIDINPHACLLVKAKSAEYEVFEIQEFLEEMDKCIWNNSVSYEYLFEIGRKVDWFSKKSKHELSQLITWLNSKKRSDILTTLAGAVLSATVRDVSYCRNDRWKLHRIPAAKRRQASPSAIAIFKQRVKSAANEILALPSLKGNCRSYLGDSRNLRDFLNSIDEFKPFDLVISSPPYGDSRTTVQYGGMSSICLNAVSYLSGFSHLRTSAGEIDSNCIGGRQTIGNPDLDLFHKEVYPYWKGGKTNGGLLRTYQYLHDLKEVCVQIGSGLKKNGHVIIIVARRWVCNWRVYTDKFIEDVFSFLGIKLIEKRHRKIKNKMLPLRINPNAYSNNRKNSSNILIPTMSKEYILIFQK